MRGKQIEKEMARNLRLEGMSVKDIAKQLNVAVGSVSLWVRGVVLTREQVERLNEKRVHKTSYDAQMAGARANIDKWNEIRKQWQEEGKALVKKDSDFKNACLLYWAEGSKTRNIVKIANSDWRLLAMFLKSMKKSFDVDRVVLSLLFYENDVCRSWEEVVRFWKSKLDIAIVRIDRKNDKRNDAGKNKNKLPYGVCEIVFFKSARIIQAIYGGIDETAKGI
jgi:transcriptional regulator with XRE-family HTH domain